MSKILSLLLPTLKPLIFIVLIASVLGYTYYLNAKVARLEVAAESWKDRIQSLDKALNEQAKAMASIQDTTTQLTIKLHKLQLPKLVEKDPQHATVMANSLFSDTQCMLERASGAKRDCDTAATKTNKPGKN